MIEAATTSTSESPAKLVSATEPAAMPAPSAIANSTRCQPLPRCASSFARRSSSSRDASAERNSTVICAIASVCRLRRPSSRPDRSPPDRRPSLSEDLAGRGSTPERSGSQRWCSKDRQSNSRVADPAVSGCGRIASGPAAATRSGSSGAGLPRSRMRVMHSSASSSGCDVSDASRAGSRSPNSWRRTSRSTTRNR
jgi:hypothetical protein